MRLSVIVLSITAMSFGVLKAERVRGQELVKQKINVSIESGTLESALRRIEITSRVGFAYDYNLLKDKKVAEHRFLRQSLEQILNELLITENLTFQEKNNTILIVRGTKPVAADKKAQGILKGFVVENDTERSPLPGVAVRVDGTNMVTLTDNDGGFKLNLSPGKYRLIFSYVGFDTRTINDVLVEEGKTSEINIALKPSVAYLQEAVVVGYGVQEKRSLTGSVGTLKPNNLGKAPISISSGLVGRVAGVQVLPSSGVPGAASAITVRGITSINGKGNSPLLVIDGVPMYGIDQDNNTVNYAGRTYGSGFVGNIPSSMSQNNRERFETDPLASINPDDIESIEILKDAYATAIYGSRGASGVILINTKKGSKSNGPKMDVQLSTSTNTPYKKHSFMNGDQYADFYTAFLKAMNKTTSFTKGINTNWIDEVVSNGQGYNAAFNISNGNENGGYYISASYAKEMPYIIQNQFERFQGRINIDQKLNEFFKVGTNLALSNTQNNAISAQQIYGDAAMTAPNKPIKNDAGDYVWDTWTNPVLLSSGRDLNPVGFANTTKNEIAENRTIGNVFGEFSMNAWLKIRSEVGVDWNTSRAYSRFSSKPRTVGGIASETDRQNKKWIINNTAEFKKAVGLHNFNATVGQSFESSVEYMNASTGSNFPNDEVLSISTAGTRTLASSLKQEWALMSYFGRLNYILNNKYMLGATYRVDGSSKFSKNKRYVGFPSVSAGWDIKQESFMDKVAFVDQLKLRGSVGLSGSDGGTGYYGNQGVYTNASGNATWGNEIAVVPTTPNNPNLKWETRTKYDLGMDMSLLKSNISVGFDYYNELTKNAILSFPIPGYLGFTSQQQNIGEISNKGVELTINTVNINKKGFSWKSNFNIAKNINKIEKLYPRDGLTDPFQLAKSLEASTGRFMMEGHSVTSFFLYEWAGVDPDNGNPLLIDKDGNKTETVLEKTTGGEVNRKYMGDAAPKFFGGFDNSLGYKGFELNAFFSYAYGNKMINGSKAYTYTYASNDALNLSPDMLSYWTTPGQQTAIPALLNAYNSNTNATTGVKTYNGYDYSLSRNTSRFLEDASYVKLRNLTLGYSFNKDIARRLRLSSLKLYAEVQNVFTITKYSGIDPEVSAFGSSALQMGRDEFTLPSSRMYNMGVKLGF
ncbi:SusC/RagA family TonB-linked outer membrane protein [Solitalea koreensis]|uniref:TonB-linked outer membrane protein, SusC/RagA family n=1 Tax=Solitalea koreensis TaxID=543615 RepID=A0A521CC93_9SPHI|nr:SusC/RagA family TonB-linked outer membrane protein [Solitalea koreensis]SMO56421.1 TonB-linked outer membrane protein, SusC/RagA family [Solitalea koreensis]